mmetsp:Transcript_1358/g.1933  ORF Transcript_1358/g.1933 Transcript_1358/m.1933 type:complete len:430 (+) Transcript_1358:187-1476(+)|eukprot:CAMPEP_0196583004 /NCGR_PEP_ID=MMETSP1081-20130531/41643_1 /TAXON_ID=36882 /ORGANISM="Pyramimonas amylifera, Strain CCMP720" /LENGTH=429 /DNA_ID=CAMNT_0041903753 /DNA_START=165 /DNA_END=1454 /DNA_ORIENTATION=+
MSRPSFRPRPLDLHQKLPVVRDASACSRDAGELRAVHHSHLDLDKANDQVQTVQTTKGQHEIPVPDVQVVDSYAQDVKPSYVQPSNYVRFTGTIYTAEDYVVYDLDNEDEEWIEKYNNNQNRLSYEKLESMLYLLELACFHATEKRFQENAASAAERGSSVSLAERQVLVESTSTLDPKDAIALLRTSAVREPVLQAVYEYWVAKRGRQGKPLVRDFQLPPPVTDTNPYNVFRPRERISRPQTRRKRENDPAAREKLRELMESLEQGASLLETVGTREKRKRDLLAAELDLLRLHVRHRHDPRMAPPQQPQSQSHLASESQAQQEVGETRVGSSSAMAAIRKAHGSKAHIGASQKKRRRMQLLQHLSVPPPLAPSRQMVFALQLDLDALAKKDMLPEMIDTKCKARFGRGGRIVFDRCNPLVCFDNDSN